MDTNVPITTVGCYLNYTPWVTKDIKAILNEKKRAFRDGNKEELRVIQGDLKKKIKEAKESKPQANTMREVTSGMNIISGYRPKGSRDVEGGVDRANELIVFFSRFDATAPVQRPLTSAGSLPNSHPLHT